jgi:hypothetical protein
MFKHIFSSYSASPLVPIRIVCTIRTGTFILHMYHNHPGNLAYILYIAQSIASAQSSQEHCIMYFCTICPGKLVPLLLKGSLVIIMPVEPSLQFVFNLFYSFSIFTFRRIYHVLILQHPYVGRKRLYCCFSIIIHKPNLITSLTPELCSKIIKKF